MSWYRYILYFIIGGLITTAIVGFEESGLTLVSRIVAIAPVFTWLAYLIIGNSGGTAQEIANHAKFVLIGTLVSWIPYMISIIYFTPKLGINKAVLISLLIFLIIAAAFSYIYFKI